MSIIFPDNSSPDIDRSIFSYLTVEDQMASTPVAQSWASFIGERKTIDWELLRLVSFAQKWIEHAPAHRNTRLKIYIPGIALPLVIELRGKQSWPQGPLPTPLTLEQAHIIGKVGVQTTKIFLSSFIGIPFEKRQIVINFGYEPTLLKGILRVPDEAPVFVQYFGDVPGACAHLQYPTTLPKRGIERPLQVLLQNKVDEMNAAPTHCAIA